MNGWWEVIRDKCVFDHAGYMFLYLYCVKQKKWAHISSKCHKNRTIYAINKMNVKCVHGWFVKIWLANCDGIFFLGLCHFPVNKNDWKKKQVFGKHLQRYNYTNAEQQQRNLHLMNLIAIMWQWPHECQWYCVLACCTLHIFYANHLFIIFSQKPFIIW